MGGAADDSARMGALLGQCWGNGSLLRSAATLSSFPDSSAVHLMLVEPSLATVWNSEIPVSLNDGSLWAGRGLNVTLSGGFAGSYGRLRFMLSPRLNVSQNEPFGILPSGNPGRSGFASPWRYGLQSADLPLRFGSGRYATIDPGETMIESGFGPVTVGVGSTEQWWGPGTRNALLLSNNAGGIPRVYLRTRRPVSTRLGELEGVWFLGQLSESPFFDRESANDVRSLSAGAVTLRAAADSGLRIGIARAVYANVPRSGRLPGRAADVFFKWNPSDSASPSFDQITSLFAEWTVPAAGLAAYAEWAKIRLPRSFRDFLVEPQAGQGFTLGVRWAKPITTLTTLRIESEFTSLEQAPPGAGAETQGFYTSGRVPQGYTQRGQSLGAAIGPGSSSQFLGASLFRGKYSVGSSLGRIRWEQDAYYRPPSQGTFTHTLHDVSLFNTLSGATDLSWGRVELSWTRTVRWNFLFQSRDPIYFLRDFDVRNSGLSLSVTPRIVR